MNNSSIKLALEKILCLTGILAGILILAACAKVGSPYGGPKDTDPPVVIKTKPPANSTNFGKPKKIVIVFDEFIQLKDIYQELIVSPPIEGNAEAQLNGKSVVVTMPQEAEYDTTTYTINFGNAIADNNEGNVLKNFQYIFSLKDYIDTMNVEGRIVNAFDHKPDKERMLVMLYKNMNDSAPILEKPAYVCRSDEEGNFLIPNLETGVYRVFALKDANGNMLYDMPAEQIAFADSTIELTPEKFMENMIIRDSALYDSLKQMEQQSISADSITPDTSTARLILNTGEELVFGDSTIIDTATVLADSVTGDSLEEEKMIYSFFTELEFFTQDVYNQYLFDYKRDRRDQLFFIFNDAPVDTIEITPINYEELRHPWFIMDASDDLDSIMLWITDTTLIGMDSLQIEVCYPMIDSSNLVYNQADTLLMRFIEEDDNGNPRQRRRLLEREEEADTVEVIEKPQLKIRNNAGGKFDLNKSIALISPTPIAELRLDSLKLFQIKDDTVLIPTKYQPEVDTNSLYRVLIHFNPLSETRYKVFFPDSVIHDIYGETNDTAEFRFTTQAEDYYGIVHINMKGVTDSVIVQLIDKNEKVLRDKKINSDQYLTFDYLSPGAYRLKLIYDRNGNGRWDTGDYLKHRQPEKVVYYPETLDVRSNWEIDNPWVLPGE